MIVSKLKDYLDSEGVEYENISHPEAFTAQEVAHQVHVKGKEMAKTVMINVDGETAMAVLPANYHVDFHLLGLELQTSEVYLEGEQEFKNFFPDCEVGAMPPFGNLYHIDVYVAESLTEDEEIVFNAGTHTDLVRMSYREFERIVKPKILKFTVPREENPACLLHA